MRLLLPLSALLLVAAARHLPESSSGHHHHKAHKRHVARAAPAADQEAVRALQDEDLRAWEEEQRVRRQLASPVMDAAEKQRLAEEHWNRYPAAPRRGGCKGRRQPQQPDNLRRRCPPRARNPHDRVLNGDGSASAIQVPSSGYTYTNGAAYDPAALEAVRAEHEARMRASDAERAALEAERAAYEERYRAAEKRRAEEEEKYRLALEERARQEIESARNREEEERRYNELNEQRQREYEEGLRRHREQYGGSDVESSRRRAPCPALRAEILDGKTYEQIFLYAHKSGCSEDETKMAIDMARRQRSELYGLKYKYPVLFYSRTRGWVKIHSDPERVRFEEQEADLDFERLRDQYKFVTEIEAGRAHPAHPPAYTEEELARSRDLAEAEAAAADAAVAAEAAAARDAAYAAEEESRSGFDVIDKTNQDAVSYAEEGAKPEETVDAIVLPQDDEENKAAVEGVDEQPQRVEAEEEKKGVAEEVVGEETEKAEAEQKAAEEAAREKEAEPVDAEKETEEEAEKQREAKRIADEELAAKVAEAARVAEEEEARALAEQARKDEELREAEKQAQAAEEAAKTAAEEAAKAAAEKEAADAAAAAAAAVEKELPDEEPAKEVEVEAPAPEVSNIGDEIVPEAAESSAEKSVEAAADMEVVVQEPLKADSEPAAVPVVAEKSQGLVLAADDDNTEWVDEE